VSLTVTVKLHDAVLLLVSVAVQLTVVTPFGKVEPEAGLHTTVAPGQLSLAVALYVTTAEHWFGSVLFVMFEGQLAVGACVSLTVTVKLHEAVLLAASLTVQLTVVVPFGKNEPAAGEQVTAPTPGQLSVAVGVV
jgi:hypothetical protein